jgi:hypothetical protein
MADLLESCIYSMSAGRSQDKKLNLVMLALGETEISSTQGYQAYLEHLPCHEIVV